MNDKKVILIPSETYKRIDFDTPQECKEYYLNNISKKWGYAHEGSYAIVFGHDKHPDYKGFGGNEYPPILVDELPKDYKIEKRRKIKSKRKIKKYWILNGWWSVNNEQ